jgi:hypothetical protein
LFSLFETRFTRKPVGLPDVGSPTKRLRNHAHYRRREIRVLPPQPPHLPRIGNSCRRTSLIRFLWCFGGFALLRTTRVPALCGGSRLLPVSRRLMVGVISRNREANTNSGYRKDREIH